MTFTDKVRGWAQINPGNETYTQRNDCKRLGIVDAVKYFDYGVYILKPGKVNGTCTVTFKDTLKGSPYYRSTVEMPVVNESN
jgi:hypothetical protein